MKGRAFWLSSPVTLLSALCMAATPDATRSAYYTELAQLRTQELLFSSLPQWAITINLLAAATLFFVWRQQRSISHVAWLLGASIAGNAWYSAGLLQAAAPTLVIDCTVLAWFYCLLRIVLPHPSAAVQRTLRSVLPLCLLAYGCTVLFASRQGHAGVSALICLALLVVTTRQALSGQTADHTTQSSLLSAVAILCLAGLTDSAMRIANIHLAQFPQHFLSVMPVAQILAVVLALYFLIARHTENQRALRLLKASLEQRVAGAESELEARYRMMTQDALDAAAIRERSQIYHSIHEDLSDKLLQLIYQAQSVATADLARAALAELRDTNKLQAQSQRPLPELLADIYAEVASRCEPAQINISWHHDAAINDIHVNAREESALSKSLREAVSNILKHAQASHIRIEFSLSAEEHNLVHYKVSDDGRGLHHEPATGRGLINMRQRLEELGGLLQIESDATGGTTLHFVLPLNRVGL